MNQTLPPVDYSEENVTVRERAFVGGANGWLMLLLLGSGVLLMAGLFAWSVTSNQLPVPYVIGAVILIVLLTGLFTINPNQAVVLQLAGKYAGSIRETGFQWVFPIYSKRKITLRVRNFESARLKVNDHDGNPIEIAAIIVWRVRDSAEAMFEVDDYESYVHVQTEAAVRNMAAQYPYDAHNPDQWSLRSNMNEVAGQLQREVQERLFKAGVEVIEARISHLAYAAEIASAMLRRQQASAVIAARQKIVEGAVTMVDMAIKMLEEQNVVKMDEKAKAAMVANLMIVLCAEHNVQPVVNTGAVQHEG